MLSVVEGKFWSKVDKKGSIHPIHGQCWVWVGAIFSDGYGQLNGRRAHRLSWELHFGKIPEGLCICHKCDNPLCVNPTHLFLGTHQDNMKDRDIKGRAACGDRNGRRTHPESTVRGEKYWSARLTEDEVRLIREFSELGCKVLARMFGVSPNTTSRIIRGKAWNHV